LRLQVLKVKPFLLLQKDTSTQVCETGQDLFLGPEGKWCDSCHGHMAKLSST